MFNPLMFALRFWLIALGLVAFVTQPIYAEQLLLPTNQDMGSVLKIEKRGLPDKVEAGETLTYTIEVTNITKNRIILDAVVYEILPSSKNFDYLSATPRPITDPVFFNDLDKPKTKGGSSIDSRILTFRWDDDRIFKAGESRKITITGKVKQTLSNPDQVNELFSLRFCTAAHYIMGFCKGITKAKLELIKKFLFKNGNEVPQGGDVPRYPKLCTENLPGCLAKTECLNCRPKNPELCTFGVKIWAKNTGTAAISNINLTDTLANQLTIHDRRGSNKIGPEFLTPRTLSRGGTSVPVTRKLRAECSDNNVGTSAQARSENPVLNVESNTPKVNITNPDLVVSAEAPALGTGKRNISWTIKVENRGKRAAKNVDVVANFSSSGRVGFSLDGRRNQNRKIWTVPQLGPLEEKTFTVTQQLEQAKGSATVRVEAKSDCDCDKVAKTRSSINYAMVVEMIDLNDNPFRPDVEDNTIRYILTVCNQVKPLGDENSAFKFSFTGALVKGSDGALPSPSAKGVDIYSVKFDRIDKLAGRGYVQEWRDFALDNSYQGIRNTRKTTGKTLTGEFNYKLKGRHCAKFAIDVLVNDNLENGTHSLLIGVKASGIPVVLEAKETEPTTVEK
ncbi:CARDB domain-containing protein [Candidatus Parabeggiatoa sp. HSG14]|uniref:CARDB domain-containing protein n=1 Tax=Candidatus Parabeggiatoa sp. HSG14 TaxID=3055593 RepID=UPI0025A6C457|nr:hypothetical protein [Thiotrichales bacterium HSG14]